MDGIICYYYYNVDFNLNLYKRMSEWYPVVCTVWCNVCIDGVRIEPKMSYTCTPMISL